jgi:virginiamycin B lyase
MKTNHVLFLPVILIFLSGCSAGAPPAGHISVAAPAAISESSGRGTCVHLCVAAEFPIPTSGSNAADITAGPDGNLWFTETNASKVASMTTTGEFTEYGVPYLPRGPITTAADGRIWFTAYRGIYAITTAGALTSYTGGLVNGGIGGLPGKDVWLTTSGIKIICSPPRCHDQSYTSIVRMTTGGVQSLLAQYGGVETPGQVASEAGGGVWYTLTGRHLIGFVTAGGVKTDFALPAGSNADGGIAAATDGNAWFTEGSANKIGRISQLGVLTEYPIPTSSSSPVAIIKTNRVVWFTEFAANKIARISMLGIITEYALAPGSGPVGIALGPDGNLWIVEQGSNKIAKFIP